MISESERDPRVWNSRLVSYDPVTAQALRDVVAWVEDDVPPPPSTRYELDFDNDLVMPTDATERGGIQPLVTLTGPAGGARIDARVGEAVTFSAGAQAPAGTGTIVSAQLDAEGRGGYAESHAAADGTSERFAATLTHVYTEPGIYFASLKVGAHRHGAAGVSAPVWNLARARVIVT